MRQNFIAQIVQLLKRWWWDMQSGVVLEENWVPSADQCQLQELQFSVPLIDLLSILLRCNGFTGIQKALVDQTGSRPPNNEHDHFFGGSLALRSALELPLSPATELVVTNCHIKSTFHHTPQSDREMVHCCVE